jgi:hypothetical protein
LLKRAERSTSLQGRVRDGLRNGKFDDKIMISILLNGFFFVIDPDFYPFT